MEELRQEFANAITKLINESIKLRYVPTIFMQMIEHQHPVEVVKQLVIASDIQPGFTRLIELGKPDLTIERILLEERFNPLFTNQEREAAKWRLKQVAI